MTRIEGALSAKAVATTRRTPRSSKQTRTSSLAASVA